MAKLQCGVKPDIFKITYLGEPSLFRNGTARSRYPLKAAPREAGKNVGRLGRRNRRPVLQQDISVFAMLCC